MLTTIKNLVKSLVASYSKPQTYGSALEAYIVSHQPQDAGDVDRLMREFDQHQSHPFFAGRRF